MNNDFDFRELRSKKNERKNENEVKKEESPDRVVENFVPPLPDYECPGAASPPAGDQNVLFKKETE
jgi:hypothetical protein